MTIIKLPSISFDCHNCPRSIRRCRWSYLFFRSVLSTLRSVCVHTVLHCTITPVHLCTFHHTAHSIRQLKATFEITFCLWVRTFLLLWAVLIVWIQDKSTDRRALPLRPTFPCHRSHLPSTETLDIFGTLSLTPIEGSPRRPYFGKLLSI